MARAFTVMARALTVMAGLDPAICASTLVRGWPGEPRVKGPRTLGRP